ncbi:MAG: sulfatase family protein, partial [Armatimonadota bacterium]
TGRFGIHTGVVGHGGTAADMRPEGIDRGFSSWLSTGTIAGMLRLAGFRTAVVSPFAERHGAWWFYAGFDEIYNTGKRGMESAEDVTPTVREWIKRNARSDNWFLHVNYWDSHTPYRAPLEFGNPFQDAPVPSWLTEEVLERHREMVGPHGARELNMYDSYVSPEFPRHLGEVRNMMDFRKLIDGYDCGIRYMDEHIGYILDDLDRESVLDETAVIVSADHAENLGELNLYAEHATADYITCRIPMIISWPCGSSDREVRALHYNLDLLPTLAELLDQEPNPRWDGKSYAPVIGGGEDAGREYLVVSQCAHTCQRGVRFGRWMYIRTWHDFYHLFPDEMLFDVQDDPHEQVDLAMDEPELCGKASDLLKSWREEMARTMPAGYGDPMETVLAEGGPYHARKQLQRYCKFLENTSRSWAIPELRRRHPQEPWE